jgi:hypothetical protein
LRFFGQFAQFEPALNAIEALVVARQNAINVVDVAASRWSRAYRVQFLSDLAEPLFKRIKTALNLLQDFVDQFVGDFRHRSRKSQLSATL